MNKLIFILFLTSIAILFSHKKIILRILVIESLNLKSNYLILLQSNSFNPAISVILDGSYKNYSDPNYSIAGFLGSSHAYGDEETTTETALELMVFH